MWYSESQWSTSLGNTEVLFFSDGPLPRDATLDSGLVQGVCDALVIGLQFQLNHLEVIVPRSLYGLGRWPTHICTPRVNSEYGFATESIGKVVVVAIPCAVIVTEQ